MSTIWIKHSCKAPLLKCTQLAGTTKLTLTYEANLRVFSSLREDNFFHLDNVKFFHSENIKYYKINKI